MLNKKNTHNISVQKIYSTDKNIWKEIVQNAKFDKIEQILATKVGINNFLHCTINFQTSLLLRDIIVNSPYVSAWGRSTQVLNDTDSKFSIYSNINTEYNKYNNELIQKMEELYNKGHLQDNIRMIVPVGSITNYAINVDIMTLTKLIMVLDSVQEDLKEEAQIIKEKLEQIMLESFDVSSKVIDNLKNSYSDDIKRDFNYLTKDLTRITGTKTYSEGVTYSVVGQVLRHRTILKNVDFNLADIKERTRKFDYTEIDTPQEIIDLVKEYTSKATTIYQTLQGSIFNLNFSGFEPNVQKMFNQRSCCINDTKQFKDIMPKTAIPPCKCNVQKFGCYVSYVNESRLKNEEKTQIPCPIWAEANGKSNWTNEDKYDYFYNNITSWKKWKQKIDKGEKK